MFSYRFMILLFIYFFSFWWIMTFGGNLFLIVVFFLKIIMGGSFFLLVVYVRITVKLVFSCFVVRMFTLLVFLFSMVLFIGMSKVSGISFMLIIWSLSRLNFFVWLATKVWNVVIFFRWSSGRVWERVVRCLMVRFFFFIKRKY